MAYQTEDSNENGQKSESLINWILLSFVSFEVAKSKIFYIILAQ